MKGRLGEIFISDSIISEEELNKILDQHNPKKKNIGIILLDLGYLDQKQLEGAIIRKNNQIVKETEMILLQHQSVISSE